MVNNTDEISSSILFVYDCAGSSLLHGLFSGCGQRGLLSSCRVWHLITVASLVLSPGSRRAGFSSCGSRAFEHKFSSCGARVDSLPLSHQGIPSSSILNVYSPVIQTILSQLTELSKL